KPGKVAKPVVKPGKVAKPVVKPGKVAKPAAVVKPVTPTQRVTLERSLIEMPVFAQKSRDQLVSGLRQGQQISVDAVTYWVKALTALPVIHWPTLSDLPAMPDLEAVTRHALGAAADLLSAQRQLAAKLTKALPGKSD
ncbi:MAG: hypothetical protein ABI903_11350, partial [Actinomycetota bacterium]